MDSEEFVGLYLRRRESLGAQLKEVDEPYLQSLLLQSLRHTDLCMAVYVELVPALVENMTKNQDLFTKTVANLETVARQRAELLKDVGDLASDHPGWYAAQISLAINQSIANANISATNVSLGLLKLSELTTQHFQQALIAILQREDEEAAQSALLSLIEFLVGLVPYLGTAISGASAIKDILEKRTADAKESSSFLSKLRAYIDSTFIWCVAAQFFANGLKEEKSDPDQALNNAIHLVEQRLEKSSA